jgi:hypothetical protein
MPSSGRGRPRRPASPSEVYRPPGRRYANGRISNQKTFRESLVKSGHGVRTRGISHAFRPVTPEVAGSSPVILAESNPSQNKYGKGFAFADTLPGGYLQPRQETEYSAGNATRYSGQVVRLPKDLSPGGKRACHVEQSPARSRIAALATGLGQDQTRKKSAWRAHRWAGSSRRNPEPLRAVK